MRDIFFLISFFLGRDSNLDRKLDVNSSNKRNTFVKDKGCVGGGAQSNYLYSFVLIFLFGSRICS